MRNVSEIGSFYIVKESGVSAGIRRIEAVVGASAIKYTKEQMNKLSEIQAELKSNDMIAGIKKLKKFSFLFFYKSEQTMRIFFNLKKRV